MGRTIINITRAIILEDNINNEMWLEFVLPMTYIKNNQSTKVLQNLSPHKALLQKPPKLSHLQILGLIIYILLYEKEWSIKSEK